MLVVTKKLFKRIHQSVWSLHPIPPPNLAKTVSQSNATFLDTLESLVLSAKSWTFLGGNSDRLTCLFGWCRRHVLGEWQQIIAPSPKVYERVLSVTKIYLFPGLLTILLFELIDNAIILSFSLKFYSPFILRKISLGLS